MVPPRVEGSSPIAKTSLCPACLVEKGTLVDEDSLIISKVCNEEETKTSSKDLIPDTGWGAGVFSL